MKKSRATDGNNDHVSRLIAAWARERPQYDLAPVEIVGRMARIMHHVDRAIETELARFDIGRATFDVLATLARNGPPYRLSQRALTDALMRTSGSVSVRIDAAERAGLVEREPSNNDLRTVVVKLTKKGRALVDRVAPAHLRNEAKLVQALSPADRAHLVRILQTWLASFEA